MDVFITAAKRTPIGVFQGQFIGIPAPELAGAAIAAALKEAQLSPEAVDEIIVGNVLSAGIGQAPSRQAGLHGGLPTSIPATADSKVCGSGMRAVFDASDRIGAGNAGIVVAGGMENMSRAPYLSCTTRSGARQGHVQLVDHMFHDGLEDAYDRGRLMGSCAEECASHYGFTRSDQDDYARQSLERAKDAITELRFELELCPVARFLADGAYDGDPTSVLLAARFGSMIEVTIPPPKTAILSLNAAKDPTTRDRHIAEIAACGRMAWQKATGYNQRSRGETLMGRWKAVIGSKLKARGFKNQKTEARIGVRVLNRMTGLGRPGFERTA